MGHVGTEEGHFDDGKGARWGVGVGRMIVSSGHFVKLLGQSVNVSLELVKFVVSSYSVDVHGFLRGWFITAKLEGPVRTRFVHCEVHCLFKIHDFPPYNLPREVVTLYSFLENFPRVFSECLDWRDCKKTSAATVCSLSAKFGMFSSFLWCVLRHCS